MALYLRYAVRSDLGLVRTNNEDSVYAGPRLLAIADGMGGHAAGEVASKIVISTLEPLDEDRRIEDLMGALREYVAEANHGIAEAVKQRKELDGMGTTLTALRFVGGQVGLVHVGDSRAYLLRAGQLSQITHDDTYVQYLVDSGKLTSEEAKDHPRKSVILRALLGSEVEPDVSIREARRGDRYLLCSDGLSDVVSTETILDALRIEDPQESADRLVELALRGGGPDNVTVIVADVVNARVGDTIDDTPVIAGAFVDPAAADVPGADSAAERAAIMSRQHASDPATPVEDEHHRSLPWRSLLLVVGVLVLIAGALGGTYAWAQSQYFVGRADSDVAIYKGVNTEFGPVKFFNVYKVSNLRVRDLNSSVRSQVEDGITANSRDEAEGIVENLRHQKLPPCPVLPLPGGSSSAAPGTSSGTPAPGATSSGATSSGSTAARSSASPSGVSPAGGSISPPAADSRACVGPAGQQPDLEWLRAAGRRRVADGREPGEHPTDDRRLVERVVLAERRAVAVEAASRYGLPPMTFNPMQRIPTRRTTELVLIIFAVLLVVSAEAAVEAARDGHLSSRLVTYASVPLIAGIVTHLVIRRVARYADPLLLPIVVLLNGLGLVMIHRLDLGERQQAQEAGVGFSPQAPTQVVWTALGVILFLAILLVVRDHRVLQRYAYTLALVGVFLLMLPAVLPASISEVNGARIWIRVAGFSLQPGEVAKILLTIFGAAYLVQKRDVLALAGRRILGIDFPRGRDFGPVLLVWLVCIGVLVRGHDLGTSLLFFGLFIVLLYVATERVSWVIVGVVLFVGGAYVAYQLFGTVRTRVDLWLHLFDYMPYGVGQQPQQSLFGLGTGGIFGTGLGNGHPELVPLATTDYIIASFGEEIGLFGLAGLLMLYGLVVARGFAAGLAVRDSFGKLLASGLAFLIALQVFVVVAGVTRLLPETGLTAPFLSYGGSSLLGSWAILALLVRISDAARRPATTPPPRVPEPAAATTAAQPLRGPEEVHS